LPQFRHSPDGSATEAHQEPRKQAPNAYAKGSKGSTNSDPGGLADTAENKHGTLRDDSLDRALARALERAVDTGDGAMIARILAQLEGRR
jgi:hypothetical protein